LPADTSALKTFWYTTLGCFWGSTLIMAFGACLAAAAPTVAANPGSAVTALFGAGRPIAQCLVVVGVVYGNVLNLYSAYMSTCTIFSGFNRMAKFAREANSPSWRR